MCVGGGVGGRREGGRESEMNDHVKINVPRKTKLTNHSDGLSLSGLSVTRYGIEIV